MFSDEIQSICKKFNESYRAEADIQTALNNLMDLEQYISSLNEYIVIKFNQCLLYDLSSKTNRSVFLQTLSDLNVSLFYKGDTEFQEEILYYIGNFNFKSHNYSMALHFINSSINKETVVTSTFDVEAMRFHKRCLKAFCMEYTAKIKEDYLKIIDYLVGFKVGEMIDRQSIIDNTVLLDLLENGENCVCDILDRLYSDDCDNILHWIKSNLSEKIIGLDEFKKQSNEIAHILAHCFSEYWKLAGKNLKEYKPEHMYMLRIAEILMKKLGIEFITCYATLKIEQNQYYTALSCLNNAKKELNDKLFISDFHFESESESIIKQVAQINFYIWYFSILARRNDDGIESKKQFKNYCDSGSDNIANTYYHILHMKELLINGYIKIRDGLINEQFVKELSSAYSEFQKIDPRHTLPKSLINEWDFLKKSYNIFIHIYETDKSNNDLANFKLYKILLNEHNNPVSNPLSPGINSKNGIQYFLVSLSNGGFVFRGNKLELKKMLSELNIFYNRIGPKCVETTPKDIANVLIYLDNESMNNDFNFIVNLILLDQKKDELDKHNIYIDCSNLTQENKRTVNSKMEEYFDNHVIYVFNNRMEATIKCIYFSYLEEQLLKLQKPLDSYIISPVSDDCAYDSQSYKAEKMMANITTSSSITLKWTRTDFGSCFASSDELKICGKKLDMSYIVKALVNDINDLKYLFLFDKDKKANNIYAFDISEAVKNSIDFVVSDGVNAYDKQSDLFNAVEKLYSSLKNDQDHERVGHDLCTIGKCITAFHAIDMSKEKGKYNNCYRNIRSYLYSYLGMMVDKSVYLLIQTRNIDMSHKQFILLVFNSNFIPATNMQMNLCNQFKRIDKYIIDIPGEEYEDESGKKIYPKSLKELSKEIKPHKEGKKFFFISYRSSGGKETLCEPVFLDVIHLQSKYENDFDFVIDIGTFLMDFHDDINKYINHEDCIGAFIYLSNDFMKSDICLQEIKLLRERKDKDDNFIICPILLADINNDSPDVIKSFIKKQVRDLQDNKELNHYTSDFRKLMKCNDTEEPGVIIETWKGYSSHIENNTNLKHALEQIGIFLI